MASQPVVFGHKIVGEPAFAPRFDLQLCAKKPVRYRQTATPERTIETRRVREIAYNEVARIAWSNTVV